MNAVGRKTYGFRPRPRAVAVAMFAALITVGGLGAVAAQAAPGAVAAAAAATIDVNSASAAELAGLPGIGASKAEAIIAERQKKPFASVDDLTRVRGIGSHTLDELRGKVSVGGR